ncbi:MAG: hypothetical protein NTZ85_14930, partial [Bacteroidia bacterium]|nr:hypothetical protein [Bacteroidia bacterium]
MKTFKNISLYAAVLLFAFTFQTVLAAASPGKKKGNQQTYITLRGKVVDSETGVPLVFATVAVTESNVAVVTNIDG